MIFTRVRNIAKSTVNILENILDLLWDITSPALIPFLNRTKMIGEDVMDVLVQHLTSLPSFDIINFLKDVRDDNLGNNPTGRLLGSAIFFGIAMLLAPHMAPLWAKIGIPSILGEISFVGTSFYLGHIVNARMFLHAAIIVLSGVIKLVKNNVMPAQPETTQTNQPEDVSSELSPTSTSSESNRSIPRSVVSQEVVSSVVSQGNIDDQTDEFNPFDEVNISGPNMFGPDKTAHLISAEHQLNF